MPGYCEQPSLTRSRLIESVFSSSSWSPSYGVVALSPPDRSANRANDPTDDVKCSWPDPHPLHLAKEKGLRPRIMDFVRHIAARVAAYTAVKGSSSGSCNTSKIKAGATVPQIYPQQTNTSGFVSSLSNKFCFTSSHGLFVDRQLNELTDRQMHGNLIFDC